MSVALLLTEISIDLQMAVAVKGMPKDDPNMKEWYENFMKNWENTPQNKYSYYRNLICNTKVLMKE